MQHEDENEHGRAIPEGPQSVWQSLHSQENDPRMEMRLTTDELCARARYRERENVWFQWIAPAMCLIFGAVFVYRAIASDQIWLRLGQGWMALLMAFAFLGGIRAGARRMQTGESCAQFMVRELEGSRRTLLAVRWIIVLAAPSVLMFWWSGYDAVRANAMHLHPASWRLVAVLLVLLAGWAGLGLEAKKRARQAEELRRAIGVQ
jgi:hypothetical protein